MVVLNWLRMTNAFILCDLLWKVQKCHAADREGSFKLHECGGTSAPIYFGLIRMEYNYIIMVRKMARMNKVQCIKCQHYWNTHLYPWQTNTSSVFKHVFGSHKLGLPGRPVGLESLWWDMGRAVGLGSLWWDMGRPVGLESLWWDFKLGPWSCDN